MVQLPLIHSIFVWLIIKKNLKFKFFFDRYLPNGDINYVINVIIFEFWGYFDYYLKC